MLGIELENTLALSRALMRKGFIVLPAGEQAEVLGLTPPLTITDAQMMSFGRARRGHLMKNTIRHFIQSGGDFEATALGAVRLAAREQPRV